MSNHQQNQENTNRHSLKHEKTPIKNKEQAFEVFFKENITAWEHVKFPAQYWIDTKLSSIKAMEQMRVRNIERSLK